MVGIVIQCAAPKPGKPGKPGNGKSPATSPTTKHHNTGKAGRHFRPRQNGRSKDASSPSPSETQVSQIIEVLKAVRDMNGAAMPSNVPGAPQYSSVVHAPPVAASVMTVAAAPATATPSTREEKMLDAMTDLMQKQMAQLQANLQAQMRNMLQNF